MDPYQEYDSEERRPHVFHHHRHEPPFPPPPQDSFFGGPPGEGFPGPFPPPGDDRFPLGPPPPPHRYEEPERPAGQYSYDEPDRPSAHYGYHESNRHGYGESYVPEQKESENPAVADDLEGLPQGLVYTLACKSTSSYNLAMGANGVVMVPANPEDEAQQWLKDCSFGMRIKDDIGNPAFSLVNKATKKLLKHAKESGQQVLSVDYSPDIKDDDILWSESGDFGEGFKTVRTASNTRLNLTIFEGQKKIRNGSPLILDVWRKADHQLWLLSPV